MAIRTRRSAKASVLWVCCVHSAPDVVSNVLSFGLTPMIKDVISGFVGKLVSEPARYSWVRYSAMGAIAFVSLVDSFGASSTLYARLNIVVKTSQMAVLISGRWSGCEYFQLSEFSY